MKIADKTILITGANRGIGHTMVLEALERGAKHIYAAARNPIKISDSRVTPLQLDITNQAQIREIAGKVGSLDILVNNAGISIYDNLDSTDGLEKQLAVNLFGTYRVTQALLPQLTASRGVLVNNISLLALAPLALIPGYCISKAALLSLTQSQRALFAAKGIRVQAALIGPTETDMTQGLDIPKASVEATAIGIWDGVENEDEEIFPDPLAASLATPWNASVAKALERQNAAFVTAMAQ